MAKQRQPEAIETYGDERDTEETKGKRWYGQQGVAIIGVMVDSTQEMMNVGENRVQNGVTDYLESKNEEKFLSIELLDSSWYAKDGMRVLGGEFRTTPFHFSVLQILGNFCKSISEQMICITAVFVIACDFCVISWDFAVDSDSGETALHKLVTE
ncbi:hypothetical protein E3N88_28641 [Mikania micrantha]|uniref:Uncharacterized protein n=1 Tax=Mikania micrantha TaxID=192012 RepID=A0A5N6N184_9ASTR|nr:hypothetical protein E3N88_28641 [Mikania micrantha]